MKEILSLSVAKLKRMIVLKGKIGKLQAELQAIAGDPTPVSSVAKKRTVSASVRRKMAAAAKARWAKIKAAKGK